MKDKRDSSRDNRKGNETSSTERRKNDVRKDEGARHKDASSTEGRKREDKKPARIREKEELSTERGGTDTKKGENRSEQPGPAEVDEDERDRRNVEEIQRRMEARKAARESKWARTAQTEVIPSPAIHAAVAAIKPPVSITDKNVEKRSTVTRRASGKTGRTAGDAVSTDVGQRELAKQWAEEDTSTTSTVTQSTVEKGPGRSKAVSKKSSERQQTTSMEDKRNLYAQDFIASQYPSVEEGVSSTVRLGRSFVSGAMGRKKDDPKMFEMAVELMDCNVPLRTTNEKAKVEVSKPPPNSIDSDVEEGGVSDVRLSQSTTGVYIELPETTTEMEEQGVSGTGKGDGSTGAGPVRVEPQTQECTLTTVLSNQDRGVGTSTHSQDGTAVVKGGGTPARGESKRHTQMCDTSRIQQTFGRNRRLDFGPGGIKEDRP